MKAARLAAFVVGALVGLGWLIWITLAFVSSASVEKAASEQRSLEATARYLTPAGATVTLKGWHSVRYASVNAHYQADMRLDVLLPTIDRALRQAGWEQCGLRYVKNAVLGTQERYRKGSEVLTFLIPPEEEISSLDVSLAWQVPFIIC